MWRRRIRERISRFVRAMFKSDPPRDEWDIEGGIGVREPRRPRRPSMGGGVALEVPPSERTDARALGDEG